MYKCFFNNLAALNKGLADNSYCQNVKKQFTNDVSLTNRNSELISTSSVRVRVCVCIRMCFVSSTKFYYYVICYFFSSQDHFLCQYSAVQNT